MRRVGLLLFALVMSCIAVLSCGKGGISAEIKGDPIVVRKQYAEDLTSDESKIEIYLNKVLAEDLNVFDASSWIVVKDGDDAGMTLAERTGISVSASGAKDEMKITLALSGPVRKVSPRTEYRALIPEAALGDNKEIPVGGASISFEVIDGFKSMAYDEGKKFVKFSANNGRAEASPIKITYVITDSFASSFIATAGSPATITDWFKADTSKGTASKDLKSINIVATAVVDNDETEEEGRRKKLIVTFSTIRSDTVTTSKLTAVPGDYVLRLEIPKEIVKDDSSTPKRVLNGNYPLVRNEAARIIVTEKVQDGVDSRSVVVSNAKMNTVQPVTVSGQTGLAVTDADIRIELKGDYVSEDIAVRNDALNGKVVIRGLADGLGYKLKERIPAGASSFVITLSGTPETADPQDGILKNAKIIEISGDFLLSGEDYAVADKVGEVGSETDNPDNKLWFDIKESPVATIDGVHTDVTEMVVGTEIEADDNKVIRVSVTPASTIKFKGKAKGASIDEWFYLPGGLKASLAEAIPESGNTFFKAAITGTPLNADISSIGLKIPGNAYVIGENSETGTLKVIAANDDVKWDIAGTASLSASIKGKSGEDLKMSSDESGQVISIILDGDEFKAPLETGTVLYGKDDNGVNHEDITIVPPDGVFVSNLKPYKITAAQNIAANSKSKGTLKIRIEGLPSSGYTGRIGAFRISETLLASGKAINAPESRNRRFDIGPAAYMGDQKVVFTAGDTVEDPETRTISVHLVGDTFKDGDDGLDVGFGSKDADGLEDWFTSGLPAGFKVQISEISEDRTTAVITITGTEMPAESAPSVVRMAIPGARLAGAADIVTTDDPEITLAVALPQPEA